MQTTFQKEKLSASILRLQDLRSRRLDMTVPLSSLKFFNLKMIVPNVKRANGERANLSLDMNRTAMQQLCSLLEIPQRYVDMLAQSKEGLLPQLADISLKTLCAVDERTCFLRTYVDSTGSSGIARAILSDRYYPVENLDIALQVLESTKAVAEDRNLSIQVDECSLSDDNFYMRFSVPSIVAHATEALKNYRLPDDFNKGGGTGIVTGFIVKNSETGKGQLTIAPMVTVMTCTNRMIWTKESLKRRHLGAQMEQGQTWSAETQYKNAELVLSQVKDIVSTILSEEFILQSVNYIEAMHAVKLDHPIEVVRGVSKAIGLDDSAAQDVLNFFIKQGSSNSAFDVAQALTYYAQGESVTPEKRYELEAIAFEMGTVSKVYDKPAVVKAKREPEIFKNLN